MSRFVVQFVVLACLVVFGSCNESSVSTPSCPEGSETCACYDNGSCDAGLECQSDLCVAPTSAQDGDVADDDDDVTPTDGDNPTDGDTTDDDDDITDGDIPDGDADDDDDDDSTDGDSPTDGDADDDDDDDTTDGDAPTDGDADDDDDDDTTDGDAPTDGDAADDDDDDTTDGDSPTDGDGEEGEEAETNTCDTSDECETNEYCHRTQHCCAPKKQHFSYCLDDQECFEGSCIYDSPTQTRFCVSSCREHDCPEEYLSCNIPSHDCYLNQEITGYWGSPCHVDEDCRRYTGIGDLTCRHNGPVPMKTCVTACVVDEECYLGVCAFREGLDFGTCAPEADGPEDCPCGTVYVQCDNETQEHCPCRMGSSGQVSWCDGYCKPVL